MGEPAYRGGQIYHALYAERKFDVARMTNLPGALRERLAKEARISLPEVSQRFASADGSVRYLFKLAGDEGKEKELNTENSGRTESTQQIHEGETRGRQKRASVEAVVTQNEWRQRNCPPR